MLDQVQNVIALVLAGISIISSVVIWLTTATKKAYAAERDFSYIRNDLTTTRQFLIQMDDQLDERHHEYMREISNLKTILTVTISRCDAGNTWTRQD